MVQFKLEDVTFFKKTWQRKLVCLACNALPSVTVAVDGATLKLGNHKMVGKAFVSRGKCGCNKSTRLRTWTLGDSFNETQHKEENVFIIIHYEWEAI
jgi:hypothetical protein